MNHELLIHTSLQNGLIKNKAMTIVGVLGDFTNSSPVYFFYQGKYLAFKKTKFLELLSYLENNADFTGAL